MTLKTLGKNELLRKDDDEHWREENHGSYERPRHRILELAIYHVRLAHHSNARRLTRVGRVEGFMPSLLLGDSLCFQDAALEGPFIGVRVCRRVSESKFRVSSCSADSIRKSPQKP